MHSDLYNIEGTEKQMQVNRANQSLSSQPNSFEVFIHNMWIYIEIRGILETIFFLYLFLLMNICGLETITQ